MRLMKASDSKRRWVGPLTSEWPCTTGTWAVVRASGWRVGKVPSPPPRQHLIPHYHEPPPTPPSTDNRMIFRGGPSDLSPRHNFSQHIAAKIRMGKLSTIIFNILVLYSSKFIFFMIDIYLVVFYFLGTRATTLMHQPWQEDS